MGAGGAEDGLRHLGRGRSHAAERQPSVQPAVQPAIQPIVQPLPLQHPLQQPRATGGASSAAARLRLVQPAADPATASGPGGRAADEWRGWERRLEVLEPVAAASGGQPAAEPAAEAAANVSPRGAGEEPSGASAGFE